MLLPFYVLPCNVFNLHPHGVNNWPLGSDRCCCITLHIYVV